MVVLRKTIAVALGALRLFDDTRYFFYLTNDRHTPAEDLVFLANDRCNQENLIDQLKHGVGATRMPVDTLRSNGAYMVMAALAWTLKAWFALLLPETGRWARAVRRRQTRGAADGIPRVSQCLHARPGPGRAHQSTHHLPLARVESLAGGVAPRLRSPARSPAVLTAPR